eukprot:scaffold1401_cov330-Pavlova_lutheri.AAC.173
MIELVVILACFPFGQADQHRPVWIVRSLAQEEATPMAASFQPGFDGLNRGRFPFQKGIGWGGHVDRGEKVDT